MKFKIKVEAQTYDIEVGDLTQRPIIVLVDGEEFSVWPEEERVEEPVSERAPSPLAQTTAIQPASGQQVSQPEQTAPTKLVTGVKAPIPGVITAISVRQGDKIAVGDEMCKLEAMKMNNSIRANRAGTIGAIHVNVGQQVRHGDLLIEFAEG
jgi:biotin carboxyl carrier protein